MSALGQKQIFARKVMSALPPKADICSAAAHVCYGPIADISVERQKRSGMREYVQEFAERVANIEASYPPFFSHRTIFDCDASRLDAAQSFLQVVRQPLR